jgi:hypothetical protein
LSNKEQKVKSEELGRLSPSLPNEEQRLKEQDILLFSSDEELGIGRSS